MRVQCEWPFGVRMNGLDVDIFARKLYMAFLMTAYDSQKMLAFKP